MIRFLTLFALLTPSARAAEEFNVCWSRYTGWEPWGYIQDKGILKKWADKYGISVKMTFIGDYVESINLYTAGKYQGCAMTNMDALTIPAVGGVDSTALIAGDYSNGNDGIVIRHGKAVKDLKGKSLNLVQLSVSHYLLARALSMSGLKEKDVKVVNTSDSDIEAAFKTGKAPNVVTWNPMLMNVRAEKGATMVFDSSKIPGEIIDLMVVRTDAPDSLKKALVGAWYEALATMTKKDKGGHEAIELMAKQSGSTVAQFEAQLKTTAMFYEPAKAAEFASNAKLKETMEYVRTFSFDHGLFGDGAPNKDIVGISFPDGSSIGDGKKIKLRFDSAFMKRAAEGKL